MKTSPNPWLSILLPTYNGEAYLESALDSIVLQGDEDIECIAVDDGSTDRTLGILHEYEERLPLLVVTPGRTGNWVRNTNRALSLARGQYVCFLHQDDVWFADRLAMMREATRQNPAVILFFNAAFFIDGAGRRIGTWRCPLPALPEVLNPECVLERLLVQNFVAMPAPLFLRESAVEVGGMDEIAWYTADWDFWLKLAECGSSAYLPQPSTGFRVHQGSQTVQRSSYLAEFRSQLLMVTERHFSRWQVPQIKRERIMKISIFSSEVNTAMARVLHGGKVSLWRLLLSFLALGPKGMHDYLRDSRIWERVSARVLARLERSVKAT